MAFSFKGKQPVFGDANRKEIRMIRTCPRVTFHFLK